MPNKPLDDWFKLPHTPFRESPIGEVILRMADLYPNRNPEFLYQRAMIVYTIELGFRVSSPGTKRPSGQRFIPF